MDDTPKKEEKTVKEEEVKETLKGLLKRIDDQQKDINILIQAADKKAMARYYARHREDLPPIVRLRTMSVYNKETKKTEIKLIMGWTMKEDLGSYQIPGTGKWTESQTVTLIYQDGTKEDMALMDFERRYEKTIKAKVVGVITDTRTKKEALNLQRLDNGEKLTIGVDYIN